MHMLTGHFYAAAYGNHPAIVTDVQFDPTGTLLASTGKNGKVIVWDLASVRKLQTFRQYLPEPLLNPLYTVGFLPNGDVVAGSNASELFTWQRHTELPKWVTGRLEEPIQVMAIHPDGSLIATASRTTSDYGRFLGVVDTRIALWRVGDYDPVMFLAGHNDEIRDLS
ncbi:MAG: hypothetical protein HC876_21805, partial [Chloroflexaceae bacterium]|nr:hypothetical protein [Chloroflexaceae bacterium]